MRARPRLLMCAPTHYDVRYEINPWMKIRNNIDSRKASAQWNELRRTLERLGARVETIPQRKGCPDMVFTANAGVVWGKNFAPSRFRYRERQKEEPAFIRYFKARGFRIR